MKLVAEIVDEELLFKLMHVLGATFWRSVGEGVIEVVYFSTEIDKIREGLVDYLFYGFLNPDETEIIQYFVADLRKFGSIKPYRICPNNPNDSELAVFKLNQFPKDFILDFYCAPSYKDAWMPDEADGLLHYYPKETQL